MSAMHTLTKCQTSFGADMVQVGEEETNFALKPTADVVLHLVDKKTGEEKVVVFDVDQKGLKMLAKALTSAEEALETILLPLIAKASPE